MITGLRRSKTNLTWLFPYMTRYSSYDGAVEPLGSMHDFWADLIVDFGRIRIWAKVK